MLASQSAHFTKEHLMFRFPSWSGFTEWQRQDPWNFRWLLYIFMQAYTDEGINEISGRHTNYHKRHFFGTWDRANFGFVKEVNKRDYKNYAFFIRVIIGLLSKATSLSKRNTQNKLFYVGKITDWLNQGTLVLLIIG